jgi:hypothetical protein
MFFLPHRLLGPIEYLSYRGRIDWPQCFTSDFILTFAEPATDYYWDLGFCYISKATNPERFVQWLIADGALQVAEDKED